MKTEPKGAENDIHLYACYQNEHKDTKCVLVLGVFCGMLCLGAAIIMLILVAVYAKALSPSTVASVAATSGSRSTFWHFFLSASSALMPAGLPSAKASR